MGKKFRDPKKFKSYKMPWGEYRGEFIHNIQSAYLYWLATEASDAYPNLQNVELIEGLADEEWQWRELYNEHIGDKYEREE